MGVARLGDILKLLAAKNWLVQAISIGLRQCKAGSVTMTMTVEVGTNGATIFFLVNC